LIFASFSATGRRHIRLAERSGVYVEESSNATAFAALLKKTAARGGFRAHNAAYFEQFLRSFGHDARLLVAKNDKQWLAAGIFTFVGRTSVYYYGASCNQSRELNAPTLLQWEAMKLAKRIGCSEYDLLGIARDEEDRHHQLARVTRFKKKFNGEIVYYPPELDVIFAPGWYRIFRIAKTLRDFVR
jgi:lipid II:glycine glycyltransferase (peptidoglycan interpeptide bridge formation enzyme)